MIIDDNYTDRYVGEIRLKKHPFAEDVILKDSGRSALEFLERSANAPGELPQLIFLDINMPEMNGFEFLEGFALLPEIVHETCKIMMLSSSLNPEDHQRIADNRFVSRFVSKPLTKDKLNEILLGQPGMGLDLKASKQADV
jgi:CheY-like chemotaxis protein